MNLSPEVVGFILWQEMLVLETVYQEEGAIHILVN